MKDFSKFKILFSSLLLVLIFSFLVACGDINNSNSSSCTSNTSLSSIDTSLNSSSSPDSTPSFSDVSNSISINNSDSSVIPSSSTSISHSHYYNIDKYNETEHWLECSCGEKDNLRKHDYNWTMDLLRRIITNMEKKNLRWLRNN